VLIGLRIFCVLALGKDRLVASRERISVFVLSITFCSILFSVAADHPQFGQAWSRNMISGERGLPADFDRESGRNVKWIADLGTESHSTATVANGRVFIGTNNGRPRDSKHQGDRGVFMCLEEETGKLLWQLVTPKLEEDPYYDWPNIGMSSAATVEGDRVYVVNNRYQVMCLDARGMANGNDGPFKEEGAAMTRQTTNSPAVDALVPGPLDADIIWSYDMFKEAGIWPHDGSHVAILIRGNHLYLNTSTGVDNTHRKIRTPDAPSLIVVDKRTGKLLARDREGIAPNIFHSTWSGPSLGKVGGEEVIAFLGGNGILYGFELIQENSKANEVATLKKLFQYDPDPSGPKTEVHRFTTNRREGPSNFYGMPVFIDESIYIAGGGDVFWGKNEAYLKRLNLMKDGDKVKVTEAWRYPLGNHVLSTPAIEDELIYVADSKKTIHCVDARTGAGIWTHDAKGEFWSSALVADGKVYIGSRAGEFIVFAAGREKRLLTTIELKDKISMTPVAANGVLYVGTMRQLFALKEGATPRDLR
jgi:outer membrane protein assembly factor BamB